MTLKRIYIFKNNKLDYMFNNYDHFKSYVLNKILNERINVVKFMKLCRNIELNNGLPNEVNWVQYLATKMKNYGYEVVIELKM